LRRDIPAVPLKLHYKNNATSQAQTSPMLLRSNHGRSLPTFSCFRTFSSEAIGIKYFCYRFPPNPTLCKRSNSALFVIAFIFNLFHYSTSILFVNKNFLKTVKYDVLSKPFFSEYKHTKTKETF